jgi:hypothetical protein
MSDHATAAAFADFDRWFQFFDGFVLLCSGVARYLHWLAIGLA